MTKVDLRTNHNPILPANLSEIDLRSMIRAITKSIRTTRNGTLILRLRHEQDELLSKLSQVCELKRAKLEARLAELETAKALETS